MTTVTTELEIWNKALADVGTRSQLSSTTIGITLGDPAFIQEAYYCNLYYLGVVHTALAAAHWNFAKRTVVLPLFKALPGTPENPVLATRNNWTPAYPQPPYVYSYVYPQDCVQARRVFGQPQQVPIAPPIFSGTTGSNPPISQRLPSSRFEIASDQYDSLGNPFGSTWAVPVGTIVASLGGVGYQVGDYVTFGNQPTSFPLSTFGNAPIVYVTAVGVGGALATAMVYYGGTFSSTVVPPFTAQPPMIGLGATLGVGTLGSGATWTPAPLEANNPSQRVVLTDQESALFEYTWANENVNEWDPMFERVVRTALGGHVTQPLTGDKALARDKITIANGMLLDARIRDGNEGLTINDHVPDWLRVRGAGGGLGYEMFFYPLGPLFPIAPLV